ncbi:hypothetical protein FB451DRAFT_1179124 [Mycena latifolia]|nr:hypothetical protein FB451DRAFT_1179124 [Mycena latifolia]
MPATPSPRVKTPRNNLEASQRSGGPSPKGAMRTRTSLAAAFAVRRATCSRNSRVGLLARPCSTRRAPRHYPRGGGRARRKLARRGAQTILSPRQFDWRCADQKQVTTRDFRSRRQVPARRSSRWWGSRPGIRPREGVIIGGLAGVGGCSSLDCDGTTMNVLHTAPPQTVPWVPVDVCERIAL